MLETRSKHHHRLLLRGANSHCLRERLSVPRPRPPTTITTCRGGGQPVCKGGREVEGDGAPTPTTTDMSLPGYLCPSLGTVSRPAYTWPLVPNSASEPRLPYWPGGVSQSASASIDLNKGPHVSQSVSPSKSACERHRYTNCCCLLAHWLSTLSSQ